MTDLSKRTRLVQPAPVLSAVSTCAFTMINAPQKFISADTSSTFADLQQRVEMLPDPKRILIRRMLDEFVEKDRYRLIVGSGIF